MRRRFAFALACAVALSAVPVVHGGGQAPARPVFDVMEKSIPELQEAMAAGMVTSRELVAAYLARIAAYDQGGPKLNAMIVLNPHALEAAEALDHERATRGPRGPLHGIPVVIKDNFETADLPTTGGSVALAGFQTGRDAFAVRRLRDAGVVIVGKTNLHELAAGITSISSMGGQTRNPYDPSRNPGGSSGGTGAAVAANFAVAGMGSDTCGSIRIPAANNSLFGLRGTAGLSSRTGIIPLSHTQDIGGPLARSVTDLALMLDATVGADPDDPGTAASDGHVPRSYRGTLQLDALKGARIGVLRNLFGSAVEDEEIGGITRRALERMHEQGAELVDIAVPGLDELLRGSSLINAEFKFDLMDYLARFPAAPIGSLGEILERGDYDKALEQTFTTRNRVEARDTDATRRAHARRLAIRALVLSTLDEEKLDALAYPPLRRKPAVIGDEPQRGGDNCQLSASTGLPAISMPAGFTLDGLPVGVELLGAAWSEPRLLALAYAYEQVVHPRRPPSTTPALVNGRPPAPKAFIATVDGHGTSLRGAFTFDVTTTRLTYDVTVSGATPLATTLHRPREREPNGPMIARLLAPDTRGARGAVTLGPIDRDALDEGHLYVELALAPGKEGVIRAALQPAPAPRPTAPRR